MSSHSQAKFYHSRGVQTEDIVPLQSSLCDTQPRSSSEYTPAGDFATPAVGLSSEIIRSQILGALAYEGAYIRQKYAGLNTNRPSHSHVVSKRVVSLPDPSVQEAVTTERNMRIVSMPEFTRFSTLNHRTMLQSSQTNSSFSSDASHNSVEPPVQRWPLSHNKMCPLDIPQTPSPPSSPDSVVIIGNEPHVSGSFLRRSCTDDDGWVTWASSPPRPIPALHGPLSLPYARCPSGAEGTVIEGDDMSHKIWGLGAGDTQNSAHTSKTGIQQLSQPVLASVQTSVSSQDTRQSAFQHQRDDAIDLSIPSTFYAGSQTPGVSGRYITSTHAQPDFPLVTGGAQTIPPPEEFKTGHGIPRLSRIGTSVNKNYHPSPSGLSDISRSGLDLPVSMSYRGSGQFGGNSQLPLNKSAPIFIPSITWNSKSAHIQQKENNASALDYQHPRRAELSQQCHIELLTPPSTSSPRWSPVFSHPIDIELSGQGRRGDPKIYSPRADLDDYSNKLMLMIQQIKHQDLINSTKRYSTEATGQAREPLVQKGFVTNSANQYHQEQPQTASSKTNVSQIFSDVRRDLSRQHPRSIPLARLIQRRLSSVAEEEVNFASNNTLPLLQNSHPRVSLEPLIYQPFIDRHAVQITTEAVSSVMSSLPTAEAIGNQTGDSESNAIVKLPRKCAAHRTPRISNGPASKRPLRNDTQKDKYETTSPQEDKLRSEAPAEKGRNGKLKKGEDKSGREAYT